MHFMTRLRDELHATLYRLVKCVPRVVHYDRDSAITNSQWGWPSGEYGLRQHRRLHLTSCMRHSVPVIVPLNRHHRIQHNDHVTLHFLIVNQSQPRPEAAFPFVKSLGQ